MSELKREPVAGFVPGDDEVVLTEAAGLAVGLAPALRSLTPARIGLRRAGTSLATGELLDFQLAHARARDAVQAELQPAGLIAALRNRLQASSSFSSEILLLHSAAVDRKAYLQRPDLGRKLDEASRRRLDQPALNTADRPEFRYELSIVLVDGLSALAVERHASPLLAELLPMLAESDPRLRLAPVCIAEQGRVAIGDEIADALSAAMVVVLIGERPGLSSPDSLGAYITWRPVPGKTTDAERNCISNIRAEGLSYAQAAARMRYYILEGSRLQRTGVALKDPETDTNLKLDAGLP